ncbi:rhamnulokinase [Anoxybacillus sp. UARK-01]|uniref:rhamnulokinase n=1 Tax=Anoxybacillaceae TaxID=3120669 RepID=UPI0009BA17B2|nr:MULTISPECIES: rhamnulokinase [Anoxybacillus]MBB3908534.1 rhamnulokinase [Anoxybacillus rupiensis]OQM44686.1 rhamnulokinase [Anoxybacillus sp. UARK-01]
MEKCCLAVDIGASNGKMVAGYLLEEKLIIEEIYRFENQLVQKGDYICWDIDQLFQEIKKGLHICKGQGMNPKSIGIDTWAVDFVLLDEDDRRLTEAVAYRDPRTIGMMEQVFQKISKEELYGRTGIQFQSFNTIYQLYALKQTAPEILERTKTFLMIPDYFHYLLTGKKVNEYTNATTTQLVNAATKTWDKELLEKLGIPESIFQTIHTPGTVLGKLRQELAEEIGLDMKVIMPATHDTASAVIAVPESHDTIYISSGTWSLIGVELQFPLCTEHALRYNFTNEGGFNYRFRFLKNIMGLWMLQEIKRVYRHQYSFEQLVQLAKIEKDFRAIVHVDDTRFLKPINMVDEIQKCCLETNQPVPQTPGQIAKCVFDSLVVSYQHAVAKIEEVIGIKFKQINIIGGGCQNELLNQMIAHATRKEVYAGPVEATAIGNIVVQLMALGDISTLNEARTMIARSFPLKKFVPYREGERKYGERKL